MATEKEQSNISEVEVVCLPFLAQGHINPMLQLAKRIASKGVRVTFITTSSSAEFTHTQSTTASINVVRLHDGLKQGEMTKENVDKLFGIFIATLSESLSDLLTQRHPNFLIYDAAMPWALDVARKCGVDAAPLCTTNVAVHAIYYLVRQEKLKLHQFPPVLLSGIHILQNEDPDETRLNQILDQFSNFHQLKFIFFNSFDKLETQVVEWMQRELAVKAIGPTVPSMYLDKRLEEDRSYGLSAFEPSREACMTWLDSKETESVVYVSFGSWGGVGKQQMEELALGLKRSGCYFLWVVKDSEKENLPEELLITGYEKGLIVNWSPQLEVLAHKAIGCFMTHCGWNSIVEAMSLGVPLVAMPQWTEQKMNAEFVEDFWEIGIRVRVNESGVVSREETEKCIREIMEGERGKQIRKNSEKWMNLAKEAVDAGGSSDNNVEDFVAKISYKSL